MQPPLAGLWCKGGADGQASSGETSTSARQFVWRWSATTARPSTPYVGWSLRRDDGRLEGCRLDVELLAVVHAEAEDPDQHVGTGCLRHNFDAEDDAAAPHGAPDDLPSDVDASIGRRQIHDPVPVGFRDPKSVPGRNDRDDYRRFAELHCRAVNPHGERVINSCRPTRRDGGDSD